MQGKNRNLGISRQRLWLEIYESMPERFLGESKPIFQHRRNSQTVSELCFLYIILENLVFLDLCSTKWLKYIFYHTWPLINLEGKWQKSGFYIQRYLCGVCLQFEGTTFGKKIFLMHSMDVFFVLLGLTSLALIVWILFGVIGASMKTYAYASGFRILKIPQIRLVKTFKTQKA